MADAKSLVLVRLGLWLGIVALLLSRPSASVYALSASESSETLSPSSTPTTLSTSTVVDVSTSASTSSPTPTLTTVVSIFYLNIRVNGSPYTSFFDVSGSVVDVDDTATTFVVTPTYEGPPPDTSTRTEGDNALQTTAPTTTSTSTITRTARPSTITQGPGTFLITALDWLGVPGRTLVNRCSLNGTVSATCNLTWVGDAWYTGSDFEGEYDGTYHTYNYSWTSGDRLGFAPVTLTDGVEMLPPDTSSSSNAGGMPAAIMLDEAYLIAQTVGLLGSLAAVLFVLI